MAELRNIEHLKLWPDNYNEGDIGKIMLSVLTFGFNDTFRIWVDDWVMAGNHTLQALYRIKAAGPDILKQYGLEHKPWPPKGIIEREGDWYADTIPLLHLSRDESTAYALADNEIARLAVPNEEKKAALLVGLAQRAPELLQGTGLDRDDIDQLLRDLAKGKAKDASGLPTAATEDDPPEYERGADLAKKWGVEPGQVWEFASVTFPGRRHRLMCGDSLVDFHVQELLLGVTPHMLWSDPPYGLGGYSGRVYKGRKKFAAVTNDDAEVETLRAFYSVGRAPEMYLWNNWETFAHVLAAREVKPRSLIVWAKNIWGMGSGYRRQHEFCAYWGDFKSTSESDLWQEPKDAPGEYKVPTQKPVRLPFRAMLNSTQPGDYVFSPFVGYGAEFVAGEQLGRTVYGMEIEPNNVALVIERLANVGLTPELADLIPIEFEEAPTA